MREIYLDNHATTPVDPRVFEAMTPYFTGNFGNPASKGHRFGWEAEEAVENGRAQAAALIDAEPEEIVFTSGATESDNMALKGVVEFYRERGDHIVTVVTEHKAVLDPCKSMEKKGLCRATFLRVDSTGLIDLDRLREAITERTVLISVMFANNETGVLQPIAEIGKIAKEKGILFHTDAAQALGKEPIDVEAMGIDLLSASSHKMYGPKGVGMLYIRKENPRVRIAPLFEGGGQERGLRSGTLNVPAIVGFGKACELCRDGLSAERERIFKLREKLKTAIMDRLDGVGLNGHPTRRLAGNLNIHFAGISGEALMMSLKGIAVSSGAACTSEQSEPSYVLRALGVGDDLARSSLRFGIGRFNGEDEIDRTVETIVEAVKSLRSKRSAAGVTM